MDKRMTLQGNNHQTTRARVFISYKHDNPDQELARKIYEGLRPRHDVFIDLDIQVGMHWGRRINAEIEQADFFVVLLSEQSINSEMVMGELDLARDLAAARPGRPRILPVRMARIEPLPYPQSTYLRYLQWIDWSAPSDTKHVLEQLDASMDSIRSEQAQLRERQVGAPGADDMRAAERADAGMPAVPGMWIPNSWPLPKGALPFNSSYYIERPADSSVYHFIRQPGVTISVFGPRQIGKTSLLVRLAHWARTQRQVGPQGKRVAWIDFQLFEKNALADAGLFYRQLCGRISDMLGIESQVDAFWKEDNGHAFNCERYIERYILPRSGPLTLIMDQTERMFDAPFRSDFFSLLRSWHDQRALVENNFRQLDIVISASTEPKLWILEPDRSPFTVGLSIDLDDFSHRDVDYLNKLYGSPLSSEQLRRLMELLQGHPYLIHFAIYSVANDNYDPDSLFARAKRDDGPFADHLNHLLFRLSSKPELTDGMQRIAGNRTYRNEQVLSRLESAGLIRKEKGKFVPRNLLYADYFKERRRSWRLFNT
jgi:hypothetical protein